MTGLFLLLAMSLAWGLPCKEEVSAEEYYKKESTVEDYYSEDLSEGPREKKSFGSTRFGPPGRGGEDMNKMMKNIQQMMNNPSNPHKDAVLEEYGRLYPDMLAKIKLLNKMRQKNMNMLVRRRERSEPKPGMRIGIYNDFLRKFLTG